MRDNAWASDTAPTHSVRKRTLRSLRLLVLATLGITADLHAQSAAWSSSLMIQAFPSPYLSDWERVPSTALLSITYSGSATADFVVSVTLNSIERGPVGTIESPAQTVPGGPATLLLNARDALLDWSTKSQTRSITDGVLRTGQIPEGRYRACATVLAGSARTPVSTACADFTILLPDAPQLITPVQGDEVRTAQPFFSWTPVLAPPDLGLGYRVRLVEVIGTQVPGTALAANRPVLDQVITGAPFLLYPLDGLALEAGKRYAWRVTATSADGQQLFRSQVASEIHAFTMGADLLGPVPSIATLGDEAIVQPGVAVLRGLKRARVRMDLASGTYTVDGALDLVLLGVSGAPTIPVQATGLSVGMRGADVYMVGGALRVTRPRGLLPASANGLAAVQELAVSARDGVTATIGVAVPGQGTLALDGAYQLTALGWYGRREGVAPSGGSFATVGRAQLQLALRRARFDLPSGALELGGSLRLLGASAGCDDVWTRADDGVLHAAVDCRAGGAIPLANGGPTDFLTTAVGGNVTVDLLADTVGYGLVVSGRFRLFGATGAPCHVEAVLRMAPDTVLRVAQTSRCDKTTAVQQVSTWLRLRYEVLRVDSVGVGAGGAFQWNLGFQADPELVANPKFALPAFVNAYATRDSIVFPALPDLLEPDATGLLDQFRIIWRRGSHVTVARRWSSWRVDDASPYDWRLEGDAFFEPTLTEVMPCLSMHFLLKPETRFRISGGRVAWTARPAKWNDGCAVQVSSGLKFTAYQLQGPIAVALDSTAHTVTFPTARGVLESPQWPPATATSHASSATATDSSTANPFADLVSGAMRTVSDVKATGQQLLMTLTGEVVNGVLNGLGVCNLLEAVSIDGRGRLSGDASVNTGCEVKLGVGTLKPYTGRWTFGASGADGQAVQWIGGARIGFDAKFLSHDDDVQFAVDSAAKQVAKDSTARADSIWAATNPAAVHAKVMTDSLDRIKADIEDLGTRQSDLAAIDPPKPGQVATVAAMEQQLDALRARRDSMESRVVDANLALQRAASARADSVNKLATTADSVKKASTASTGLLGSATAAAGPVGGALDPPTAAQADNPDVIIDWTTGRIIKGAWRLKGPIVVEPFRGMAFRMRDIAIDSLGLRIDGSVPLLYVNSRDSSMTQWSGVRMNLVSRQLTAGVVTFAQGFGMELGTKDTISGKGVAGASGVLATAWEVISVVGKVAALAMSTDDYRIRPPEGATAIVNGLRVDVGGKPFLDPRGLALRGESQIVGSLFGGNTSATLRYSDDFALRSWTQVAQGSATLVVGGTPVAIWEPAGWRPAVAELLASVIPRRLPLPSEAVAYLELRDSTTNALLVDVTEAGSNWHLRTTTGPVGLVVPALAGAMGGHAPAVRVGFDLLVDKRTFALQSGGIAASVAGVPGFDLAAGGLPFAIDTLRYDRLSPTAPYQLSLQAALALLGEDTPTGRVRITVDGNGAFGGDVVLPIARAIPLGSPEVTLQVNQLGGSFSGSVATGLDFQIDAIGGLRLALPGQAPWTLGATFRVSPHGAQFVNVATDGASMLRLGAPGAALLLGNPRIPLLAWDATTKKVRFDVLFDLGVEIAALGNLTLPTIRDIHVRETGIDIPAFDVAEVSSQMVSDGAFGQRASGPIEAAGFGVRPLALRVGAINWRFGTTPLVDVRLDVELSLRNPAAPAPNDLSAFKVRVLDLGWRDGALRGTVEPVQFAAGLQTPFGAIRSAWGNFAVGAQSEAHIYVGADIRLPDVFGCATSAGTFAVARQAAKDTLEFLPNGSVRGAVTGFAPACTGALGPLAFRMIDSRIAFSAGPNVAASVVLDGTMRVSVATGTATDSVRADGRLAVNLVTGEITEASVAITQPFNWQPDPRNPIVNFTVQQARLDRTALTFTGGGQLRLVGGGGAAVQFNDLAWAFRERRLVSGSATVTTDLAIGAELDATGLRWGAFPANTPRASGAGFRLTLPSGLVIDRDGVAVSGTAVAALSFGDSTFAALSVGFENGFRLATDGEVRVTAGAARFRRGTAELIATVDSTGFRPGDLFALLPIPDRLNLPSADVAYLVLGDATRRFVEMADSPDGRTHLRTPVGRTIDLVLPALAYGSTVPRLQTAFDLIVEPRTMRVVGGSLQVDAPAGQSLVPLQGLPVDITRLGFAAADGVWQLRAGARVRLPASLSAAPINFTDIVISPAGLSGVIEAGRVTDSYTAGLPAVVQARLAGDSLVLAITGARLDLTTGQSPAVALAGTITSAVLKNAQGQAAPLFLRGSVSATGFDATADLSAFGSDGISLGVAVLRPSTPSGGGAIRLVANQQRAAIEFGASISMTSFAPGLTVAVDTIHIGSDGVRVSPLSISNGNAVQFNLFGLGFALRDSIAGGTRVFPALSATVGAAGMQLELSGNVTAFENTSRFYGLRINTAGAGSVSLAAASLISRPIVIIPDRLRLLSLALDQGTLRAAAAVSLPAPFDADTTQRVTFNISPDGSISGGATLVLIREAEGLATARKKIDLGVATFHIRYLAATVDFERPRERTAIDLVSDIYIQNKPTNLVRLGSVSGGTVQSGLRVSMTGVTWSGLQMVAPIEVKVGPVLLTLSTVTAAVSPRGLSASFSGGLGLAVQVATSTLTFQDVGFTDTGEFNFGAVRFGGGSIKITDVFSLDVRNLGFSSTETTISVPGDNVRSTGQIPTVPPEKMVRVNSYLSFGANVTIASVFSGGVKRVLVYQLADDSTNHILVDSLAAKVSEVFELQASMRFDEYTDGFLLQVAGAAKLMGQTGVSLVGVIGNRGGIVRAGVFIAVSAQIPIIPGAVMLTNVGGGFFINPEASDLNLVRQVAGLTGGPSQRMGAPPAGDFAIMLYARVVGFGVGNAAMVAGKVLVTVTDRAFRLDGNMIFLGQADRMTGDIAVQVGWSPVAYLLGDVEATIKFDSTAVGTARLQFAVGGNAFAIKGGVHLTVLKVLEADATVIVVPSGFATDIVVTLGRTFWVVKLEAQLKGQIWFRPATSDLGAYVEIRGVAEIPGLIGVEANLRGALIIMPKFALYAAGGGRAFLLGNSVQIQFWLSIASDGFGGGLGENAAMNAAIERARQVSAELKAEADSIIRAVQNQVNNVTVTPVFASEATLARVFDNAKGWAASNDLLTVLSVAFYVGAEQSAMAGADRTPYFASYWDYFTQRTAPSDTIAIAAIRAEAQQKLAILASRRDEMIARIAALQATVDSVRAVAMPQIPNPVRSFSAGDPSIPGASTAAIAGASHDAATLGGLPVFDLDDAQAAQNRVTISQVQAQVAARQAEMARALLQAQGSLDSVRSALSATASSSLMGYLRLWGDAVEATEHQNASTVDYQMRRWKWARQGLAYVRDNREAFRGVVTSSGDAVVNSTLSSTNKVQKFQDVADARARVIGVLGHDPGFVQAWTSTRGGIRSLGTDMQLAAMRQQADTFAMQMYSRAGEIGLASLDSSLALNVVSTSQAATIAVQRVRAAHAEITARTVVVSAAQLELYGAVFDIYDAMLRELRPDDSLAVRIRARRDAIAPLLVAPTIGATQATAQDFGFMSRGAVSWTATHAAGVPEYTIAEAGEPARSLGSTGNYATWRWTTDLAGGTQPFVGQVGARAAGGTRTTRAIPPLAFTFARGTPVAPVATTAAALPPDMTPPSTPVVVATSSGSTIAADGSTIVWTTRGQPIVLEWSAMDAESGIQEYRYHVIARAVPTGATATLTAPNLTVTRVAPTADLIPWTSLGGRTSMLLTPPTPPVGKVAQVELVAVNGAGLVGGSGTLMLREDPTAPAAPAGTYLMVGVTSSVKSPSGRPAFVVAPACVAGSTVSTRGLQFNTDPGPSVTGSLAVARPALTDAESGVRGWYARMAPTQPTIVDGTEWVELADTAGAQLTIANMPYERPLWVAIAARNGAGAFSVPVTSAGTVRLADRTVAPAPVFCLSGDAGRIAVRFSQVSRDPESGIVGYQVRLRTQAGAVLRDWPVGTAIDLPASTNVGVMTAIPGIMMPTSGQLVAEVRAVNGAGVGGDQAASGPLLVDGTAPPRPTITAVVAPAPGKGGVIQFRVTVTASADPESGFGGLEVRVDDQSSTSLTDKYATPVVPWTAIPGAIVGSSTYIIGLPPTPTGPLTVQVRARNGVGMYSTAATATTGGVH